MFNCLYLLCHISENLEFSASSSALLQLPQHFLLVSQNSLLPASLFIPLSASLLKCHLHFLFLCLQLCAAATVLTLSAGTSKLITTSKPFYPPKCLPPHILFAFSIYMYFMLIVAYCQLFLCKHIVIMMMTFVNFMYLLSYVLNGVCHIRSAL